ncbi:hypothetical protein D1122_12065 [Cereibacter sphaeroides]|nr:hypothetical protein D1122_12065 [Cereibacter sphaeroides]
MELVPACASGFRGAGARGLGLGTWDLGLGTWDLGLGRSCLAGASHRKDLRGRTVSFEGSASGVEPARSGR